MKSKFFFNILEYISEIVGWVQIFISPLFIGSFIGYIVYNFKPDTLGMILGLLIGLAGLILGVILANNSLKNGGTIKFLSRVISTPDIDKDLYGSKKEDTFTSSNSIKSSDNEVK